jgi:hypothetical protein
MWHSYFNGRATIYAIDINPECKKFETDNVKIFTGSQEDPAFLKNVKSTIPQIDVLIDDGGHTMKQQIITFNNLFDHVTENGIYICEDLHTSYWKNYGGGYKNKRSFIEFSKHLIDKLHAWHSKNVPIDNITKSTHSLHFYDSVLVIEKRKMSMPTDVKSGTPSIKDHLAGKFVVNKDVRRPIL